MRIHWSWNKTRENKLWMLFPSSGRLTVNSLIINHIKEQQGTWTRQNAVCPWSVLFRRCFGHHYHVSHGYRRNEIVCWCRRGCLCKERSQRGCAMLRWTIKTCISLGSIQKQPIWAQQKAACLQAVSLRAEVNCGWKVSEGMCAKDSETETYPRFTN